MSRGRRPAGPPPTLPPPPWYGLKKFPHRKLGFPYVLWFPIVSYGLLWIPMDPYVFLWIPKVWRWSGVLMDSYPMDYHGFL